MGDFNSLSFDWESKFPLRICHHYCELKVMLYTPDTYMSSWRYMNHWDYSRQQPGWPSRRTGLRYAGAPDNLIICRPFKPISFKLFRPRRGLMKSVGGCMSKLFIFFREILLHVESQSLPATYFRLFQWRHSALIGWHPGQLPGGTCLLFTNFDNLGITFVDTAGSK
jgi:hypothetical protein